ncbi:tape measure protein [Pseudotamlana carrageenivorans]|uniref:Tape measure protein N-terminal domain-containing protein n=1 Tax=Pseudotamlana carrageenivorans TaxID=2069432 RepID=A0A2I7SKR8_9FLAO|nr:tape measure protein [Tamlana carrageenivorans]AUS06482.1 hypothetical protein C1A40_13965 [Tamlana carrageenivorans]
MNAYAFIIKMKDYASSGLKKIAQSVGQTTSAVNKANSANATYSGGLRKIIGLAGGLALAYGTLNAASALFFKGVELEQTKVKFEVLLGSVEKGTAMLKELNEYANFTPFSNNNIIKASETMLGFGIVQEKIMGNLEMLGDVAMGNEQKLGSLSLVYSQVMATGRLMGQDLLQMINQGFNPLQIISQNTGISMGVLKDQMEKGAISAAMVEEAFRLATSEGGRYHGMTEKMAESAGGKWSTFMGKLSHTVAIIGEKFALWISPLIDVGIAVVEHILPFGKAVFQIMQWVIQCTPLLITLAAVALAVGVNFLIANASLIASSIALGAYNVVAWLAVTAAGALSAAQAALNFVMAMNPISLVILGIGALIAIIWALWNKVDWLRGGIMGIWEVMKGFGKAIKDYVITRMHELISGLSGMGKALMQFFKGDFKAAWETGKKAAGDLMGVNSKKKLLEDGLNAAKSFSTGYNNGLKLGSPKDEASVLGENAKAQAFKKQEPSSIFSSLLDAEKEKNKNKKKSNYKGDSIVSGGSKMTHINITIGKLQDKTEIHVAQVEKGLDKLGEKVQEILLRSVNSVNQMQTG